MARLTRVDQKSEFLSRARGASNCVLISELRTVVFILGAVTSPWLCLTTALAQPVEPAQKPPVIVETCRPQRGTSDDAWFACMARRQREEAALKQERYGEMLKRTAYSHNPLVLKLHEEYNSAVKYPDYCFRPGAMGYAADGLTDEQLQTCIDAAENAAKNNKIAVERQNADEGRAMDARLAALPGAKEFTSLTPCPNDNQCAVRNGDGSQDMYFKVWTPWIKASNGFGLKVDMASVLAYHNGWAAVSAGVPGVTTVGSSLKLWAFDCAGHMNDLTDGPSPVVDIPPKSIAAEAANVVCRALQRAR